MKFLSGKNILLSYVDCAQLHLTDPLSRIQVWKWQMNDENIVFYDAFEEDCQLSCVVFDVILILSSPSLSLDLSVEKSILTLVRCCYFWRKWPFLVEEQCWKILSHLSWFTHSYSSAFVLFLLSCHFLLVLVSSQDYRFDSDQSWKLQRSSANCRVRECVYEASHDFGR